MKTKLLIAIIYIGIQTQLSAQFQGNFVQFFNNETYLNPAFAGTQTSGLNISSIARTDYSGIYNGDFLGASKALITIDKRFDKKNFGLAANMNVIKFGEYQNYDLALNYSYHLNLGKERKICMGLKAGGVYQYSNIKQFEVKDDQDNVFSDFNSTTNTLTSSIFNTIIGAGFAYESEKLYLGIASPNLIGSIRLTGSGGYKFFLNQDLYIEPNFLFRYVTGFTPKVDINTIIAKNESYWAGVNYSHNNSVAIMAGIYVNGRIKIGYAYDFNINLIQGRDSHELMLQWDLEDVL